MALSAPLALERPTGGFHRHELRWLLALLKHLRTRRRARVAIPRRRSQAEQQEENRGQEVADSQGSEKGVEE